MSDSKRCEACFRKSGTGLSCADKTSDKTPLENCITIITQYFESQDQQAKYSVQIFM